MKKTIELLGSAKLTFILLIFISVAIGFATFVENTYDTATAKAIIYNSHWLEFVLLLVVLNMIASIIIFKLYTLERLAGLLFHLGFIVMIIGAAVTRYIGFEGTMHIREGSSVSYIYSSEPFFIVKTPKSDGNFNFDFKADKTKLMAEPFEFTFDSKSKGKVKITLKDYIPFATEEITQNAPDGKDMIEIKYAHNNQTVRAFINFGEIKQVANFKIAFANNSDSSAINIYPQNGKLLIKTPVQMYKTQMNGQIVDSLTQNQISEISGNFIYKTQNMMFLFEKYYKKAKFIYVPGNPETNNADAIIADIEFNGENHEAQIFGGNGYIAKSTKYTFNGLNIDFSFGNKTIEIPFEIYLDDFILERYPGSENPSSYESRITLIDRNSGLQEKHRIYMNNILDYGGYRFFQSSFDQDEKGTVLSVSHDRLGTLITYLSYIMLLTGFTMIFFSKKSRFTALLNELKSLAANRKIVTSFIAVLFIFSALGSNAQTQHKVIDKQHADKFGRLVVQTFDGRFEPVNTLAYDIIHKITKKNYVNIPETGKIDAMQFMLELMTEPDFWKSQKIISLKEESVKNILGTEEKYVSFNDFFNKRGEYKLAGLSEAAYRKTRAEQTTADKDIIKVNERLNIFLMTTIGSMLKIFPEQNSENHKWLSIDDSASYVPLSGSIKIINEDLNLDVLNYANILHYYLQNLSTAKNSGNYSEADKIISYFAQIQKQLSEPGILPSESKLNTEVHYNKANIFNTLKYVYMILSVFLVFFAFVNHLKTNPSKFIKISLNLLIVVLAAAFIYHTYGLVLRWYLSGHAPWSNGYEALIFVAWGGILAGFIFMKYSKITLAATALLAFFTMLTAGFSSYDPQLTNLQPVLKSYWLIIHVAVIVISYGFLGLGFVLGLLNLIMETLKNTKNAVKYNQTIKELTYINEINLIIGIVLATIGTFLGAVWANESWGRYWGWDAKETWALIIVLIYAAVLHLRLIPSLKKEIVLNISSVLAFASVIMTFFGVNFYFTKGMHSYASGEDIIFPFWAWIIIFAVFSLIAAAVYNKNKIEKQTGK